MDIEAPQGICRSPQIFYNLGVNLVEPEVV